MLWAGGGQGENRAEPWGERTLKIKSPIFMSLGRKFPSQSQEAGPGLAPREPNTQRKALIEIPLLVFCWCCSKSTLLAFRSTVLCFRGYMWIPVLLESGRMSTPGPGWMSRGALRPLPSLAHQTWHCLCLCDRDKDLASCPMGFCKTHLPEPQTMRKVKGTTSCPQQSGY